jgi:hypothetical protein
VSKLLAENRHFRMHEELGTGPGFFYIWNRQETSESAPVARPVEGEEKRAALHGAEA